MTRSTLVAVFAATAAIALASTAFAGEMTSAEKIKKMDTNGDGVLSAAEHEAGARMMFAQMDANKDGRVTAAEMDASPESMMHKDHSMMNKDRSKMGTSERGPSKSGDATPTEPMTDAGDDDT
jgi:hypothetical protein